MLSFKPTLIPAPRGLGQMVRVCAAICMAYGASMAAFAAQPAATLPTGGQVAAGQAAIGQSGNTLTVNQTSQRAVLNWNTFNVGSNAAVEFKQPNSQAVVLNRVTSATPSQIDGAIHANGRVIISNTNGVTFGKGAEVNAGAVVATTMNQSDADFMSGSNTFEGNGTGKVVNKGKINITDPQGYVALLAPEVRNQGVILATVSSHNAVVVGAAEKLTLNFKDSNLIGITVDKAAVNALIQNKRAIEVAGGLIVLAAGSANQLIRSVIQNTGQISANSMTSHGGVVELVAGTVNNNGRITANAQGVGNGGTVKVVADNVALGTKSDIQVNAGTHGNGGTVQIWANQQAAVAGQISATGGSVSGNGGSIGTSAKLSVTFDPQFKVDTSAKNGRFGQWVIDPLELTIDANAASLISAALRNTNVTLDATGSACVGSLANCTTSILPLVNFLAGANIYSDNASTTLRVLASGGTVNVNNNIDAGQVYFEAANISVKGNIGSTGGANGSIVLLGGQINILGGLGSNGQGTNATNSTTTIGNSRRRLAANAGLAADDSSYTTNGGSILISATGDVVIDTDATVTANGLAGGQIAIVSQLGTVTHRGVVDAVGTANQGGNIKLEADSISLEASSQINAVGALGGGTVLVGGDWQGGGNVRQATFVTMQHGATIDASAIQKGNGGKVVLWSDVHNTNSITEVSGSIYAKGGANGGDGGQVETSGRLLKVDGIAVNTSAIGIAGNWLLDPDHIVINTGGSSYTNSSGTITSNGCTDVSGVCSSYIDHQIIESALSSGNVTIQTVAGKNITVQSDGTITSSSTNTLTFSSGGNITFEYQASNGGINAAGVALVLTATNGSVSVVSPLTVKSIAVNAVGFTGNGNLTLGTDGLSINQSGDSTYTGAISDISNLTAKLTKDGLGTLTLSGASTFTGGVAINGGTLKLGASFNVATSGGSGGGGVYVSGTILDSPFGLSQIRINGGGALDLNGFDFSHRDAVHHPIIFMSGTDAANQAKIINSATSSAAVYSTIKLTNTSTAFAIANVIAQKTGSGTLTISGRISDDTGVSYAGIQTGDTNYAGKVILNSLNTFGGGITVNAGTLQAGWEDALGVGDITVLAGAVLDIKGFDISTEGTLTLNGTGISGNGALINSSASAASYPGVLALGSSASIVAETGSISIVNAGNISGATYGLTLGGAQGGSIYSIIDTTTSSVTKTGSGTWLLTGANTYSGATTVSAGTLKSGSATAFGSGNISVTAGAVVDLNGQTMTSPGTLTLNGTGISGGGALINTTSNPATYAGLISLGSSATIVGDTGSIALTAAGIISGSGYGLTLGGAQGGSIGSIIGTSSGALTKIDGGTWSLSGSNTYTGITSINGGTLSVSLLANGGTASGIGQSANAAANLVINGGILQYTGAAASTDRLFTLASNGGAIDASGSGELIWNGPSSGNNITVTAATSPTLTLTGAGLGTFRPVLANAGVGFTTELTKTGAGTWTLTGSNTYTGVTNISGGVLSASVLANGGASSGIGASANTADRLVINGGTLRYTGSIVVNTGRTFTIGENGATLEVSGSGQLQLNGSTGNAIAFSSASSSPTLTLTGTGSGGGLINLELTNPSLGVSSLTKTGSGTWSISAGSTYTGVTTISGGVLSTNYLKDGGVASSIGQSSNSAGNLVINGGTLKFTGTTATTINRLFTVGASGATIDSSGSAALTFGNASNLVVADNSSPTLTLAGSNTQANSFAPIFSNAVSGTSALTKIGVGTWTLSGSNTYTGGSNINAGTLNITSNGNLGASGDINLNGGTLKVSGSSSFTSERTLNISASSTINNSNSAGITFTGNVQSTAGSSTQSLTISGSNSTTFSTGIISNGSSGGTLSFIQNSSGTTTLSGNNTFSGGSTISSGFLKIGSTSFVFCGASILCGPTTSNAYNGSGSSSPLGIGSITISANGTLDLNGIGNATSGYLYNPITMAGTWDNGGSKTLSAASLTTSSGTSVGIYSPMVLNKGANPDLYIGLAGFERIYLPNNSNSTLTLYGVISDGGVGTTSAYLEIGQNNTNYGLQSGTVVLAGQNTYSGKISINQAVLKVGGASALGSVGLITIGKAINDTNGTYTSGFTTLDLAGQSIATPINLYTGNLLNSTGSVDVSGGITVSSGAAGVIAASNLATLNIKTTGISSLNNSFGSSTYTGTVILSAANTAGTTAKLAGGTLQLANASALPNAPLAISAGTLDLMGYSPSIGVLSVTGAATIQDSGATPGALTASSVNVSNSSGTVNIFSILAGAGGLTKSGAGSLSLSAVNTYSGITTISGGTLSVSLLADGGVASGIGQSSNAANNLVINGGALQFLGGTPQSSDRLFTVGSSGATIDIAGAGALTFSNAGAIGVSPATITTLTLTGSGSASLAASFSNPATSGTSSLTKDGSGIWALSSSNSFTGITRINGGVLSVSVLANGGTASGIGQSSNVAGNLIINGGTLRYTGAEQSTDRSFTIGTNGATLDASGTGLLTFASSGNVTFTGSANITLTLSGNGNGEFTSRLVNPSGRISSLLKSGTGTWKINASSTYTGTTDINGGILKLGVATPFASSSVVTVNSGGVLDVNNFTVAKLVKLNAGTVTNSTGQNGALSAGITLLANSTLSAASGASFVVTNTMITGGYGLTIGSGSNLGKVVFGSAAVSASGSYTGTTTVIAGATLEMYVSVASPTFSPTFNSNYDGAGTIIIQPANSGNSIALGGTTAQFNLPMSLFASGGKFADGFANIVIGNSSAGSSLTVTGAAAFMDSVTLLSGGNITINAGASVSTSQAGGNLVVAASVRFLNLAGSSALSTTDAGSTDRWIVYSADPSTTNFGTSGALVSGNKAYWGSTYSTLAPTSIASGNRYVFSTAGTVTVTTSNASMTYGVPVDLSSNYTVSNESMNAAPTGAPYISNVQADLFTTAPTISSTGNTVNSAVGQYDITASGAVIATGFGTLTYTNTGKLTVNPATITISVSGVKTYDGLPIFNAADLTYIALPNGDTLATATANSANVADNGSNYFVDFSMATGTKSNYVLVNGYNASTNSATINKANAYVLVNASQSSYYGVAPVVNYSFYSNAAGTGGSVISPSPSGTAVFANAPAATSNAATYALKYASGLTSANYLINAATSDVNYVVNPAPVVVTGASNTVTYNGSLQTNSGASVTVNGNAVSLVSSTLTTGIGSDSFTLSGYGSGTNASGSAYADTLLLTPVAATVASNYSMTYNNGGLTIGKANAYVMVSAGQASTYGIAPTINYSFYSNAAGTGGAVVTTATTGTASITNAPTSTSDAATYSLTYASGLSSTNYTFNAATSAVSYVVNPAPLIVTGVNNSLTYNGSARTNSGATATVNANAVTVSGNTVTTGIGADSFTLSGYGAGTNASSTAYADNLSLATSGSTRAANYSISYSNGGLTIDKANAYVFVTSGQSSTYGVAPTINYTFYSNAAGTGGAAISPAASGTAVFTNAPTTTSDAATYSLTYATGLSSTNYLFNAASAGVNYVVNPAAVVVSGVNNSVTYNGALQTNTGATVTVNGSAVNVSGATVSTGIGSDSFSITGYASGTNASTTAYADSLALSPMSATLAGNYSISYTQGGLSIGKASAYVHVTAGQSSTYGLTPVVNYSFYSNAAGTGGAVVTTATTGTASITNTPTSTSDAATYSLTYASGLSSTNYTFSAASGGVNYVVNPAPLVVTGANTSSTYTGSLQTNSGISATVNGNAVTVSSNTISTGIGSDSFTVAGFGSGTNASASAYADNLAATRVGVTRAANYSISYTNGGLTIGKANAYVLVTAGQSSTYGISPTVNYTFYSNAAGTGGAVISSATSGAAVFTNAPTATSNAAAYSLTYASGLSATNYIFNPAASAVNYVVNPAPLVLSGTNNTVTYNGSAQSNSGGTATVNGNAATVTSGTIATGIGSDSFTISGYATGTDASTTAYGDQLVVTPASGTLAGNYAVSYNQGGLTIGKANAYVLVGAGQSSTYGTAPVINYSFYSNAAGTGGAVINTATNGLASFNNAPSASSNAATYSLTYASGLASTNYAFNAASSGVNFVVNPAPLVVTVNNDSKFVTQLDASGFNGVSYSGFVLGQNSTSLGGGLLFSRTNSTQNNAGSYPGVLQATGLTSQNYAISYVAGDYTIVPAETLIIKTTNMGVTYGANIALAPVSVEYLTGVSNVNGPNVLTTLTQTNASGNTFTYSDGVGGTATFTLAASGTNSSSSNLVVGNYNIAGVNFSKVGSNFNGSPIYSGVLAVNQKAVSASTTTVSKVYDSTTAMGTLSLALSNVVPGDVVSIGGVGSFAQAAVGSNIQYQVSNLTLNGTDSANYYLSGGSSFTGNNGAITAATLNVVGANTTLAYTGTALSNSAATVSGLKGSDSFTVTGYGTGTNASVTPYADTLQATADAGTSAGNYNIIYTNGALTIGKANAYVLVTPSQTSTYGLTPGIAYSFYSNASGVGGSAVVPSATGTAVFTNAPTATSNAATYSLSYASGLTSSNYILNPASGGVNYVVNPAPLVVTGANNNATYSGLPQTNSGASATVNGTAATVTGNSIATGIGSDTFTIGGYAVGTHASTTAYADAFALTAGSGTLPGNYSITYNNGGLTIGKATLNVTAENKTKLYGDANPSLTYAITGYVNGEGATALTGSPTIGTGATLISNVGTAPITAVNNNLTANDYNFNFVNGTLTISPANLSVVGANTTVTYTAATQTNSAANVLGLKNGDSFTITGYATGTNASTTAYSDNLSATAAAGTSAANYNIAYTNGGITIGKANLNVSATASLTGHVYNALPYTGTYTTTLLGSDSITVTGMATGTNAGTYTSNLQVSGAALSNYNTPVISNANLVIDPKPVTLTNNVSTTTYNATSTYASLMSTAGFSATALVGADAVGSVTQGYTVSGAAVSGIAQAGTFVATPSAAVLSTGNVNNYAFTYVPSTNTVAKANVIFTATASLTGNVYNGSAFTGTYTSTLLGSDTATVTGLATGINAGTYASNLQVSGAAMANYNTPLITNASLVIDQKPLTISGQTAVNKVYTGTTAAALDSNNASLVGVVSGDAVTLDASNAFGTFASDNVANGIAVTVAGNALSGVKAVNYSLSQPTGLTANITPAPLVVTANDDAKFVTQNDAAGFKGVSYSGFVAGQGASDLTGSLVITRSNSSQNNAGPYAGVLVPSGLTSTNYSISYVNGDYTIVPAQTLLISTPNTSVNYGADISLSPLSVQYLDGANVLKNLTQTSATGNTFTYSDDVGGSATFTLAGIGNSSTSGKLVVGNYDIAGLNFTKVNNNFNNTPVYTGVLTVAQQSVSASTSTVSKVYDGTTAMNGLSLALSNVVTNDVVTVGGVGAFAQANKGTNINYSVSNLTLTGADSGNYYLSGGNSFNGTNGEITAAPLTVVGATTNTTYTGLLQTNAAATVTGLKGGDAFTVTGYASATNASATPYADNLVATPTAGTTASNYSITYTNGALNIAKAPLTVTATSLTKPYDGQLYSGGNGVTYSGFVNNETLAVLGGTLSYTGTSQGANNAGTYVLTPAGLSSNNYAFNYVSGSLTIQPVVVAPEPTYWPVQGTLTGSVAKAYDGTVSASLLPSNYVLTGFISGQGATVLKTQGVYDNANVGAGKLVTVSLQASDFQATGTTNLANYILPTSISGRVGVISKATVSVTADKLSKPFMGVDPALTYTVSGLAGRDVNAQVLTGSPSRTPGEALGTYSVNVGSFAVSSNYELVFTPGSLQVVPGVLSSASSVFPFERKAQMGVVNTVTPVLLPEASCLKPSLLRHDCAQSTSLQSL